MLSYLDGASLGMLATALAGGVAGVAVFFKMHWHRFLGLFSKSHRAQADEARSQLLGEDAEREPSDVA
jgi:hypothetical protein